MLARLAEIVISEGLVGASELTQAVESSDKERQPLVVALIREQGIDEVALVAAFKKHLRIKTLDPAKAECDSDAVRELTRDDCRRLRAVPMSLQLFGSAPRVLQMAMADPTDTVSIAELEHLSNCVLEPVLATLSTVEELIETVYRHAVTEVMPRAVIERGAPKATKAVHKPTTTPFHRISDEAGPVLRTEALLRLCVAKGVFEQSEYEELLRTMLREQKD